MKPMAREEMEKRARSYGPEALRRHALFHGKIQVAPKCPIEGLEDFAIWYTPGVAAPSVAIHESPAQVYDYTNRGNTIAIVSDGTRVLGLGDIGPEAALPVMEGKSLLFKFLGGVDAVPLCLKTRDADELVRAVEWLEPSFGGINLEDISQPKCFRVLDLARERTKIPVWHDDQQGTATVVLAGLLNALDIVGKRLDDVRIALIGAGAANIASYRLLRRAGVDAQAFVVCDSRGILHANRRDVEVQQLEFSEKWKICRETNPAGLTGGIEQALRGADVCIAFSRSGPGVIDPAWIGAMARDPVVLACANPVPEIWPWDASDAGACIVATGRSDFPNQLNNALAFPGIFRGVLDVRATTVSDEMAVSAAEAIAGLARKKSEFSREFIAPRLDDIELAPRVAAATGSTAVRQHLARVELGRDELYEQARASIARAREQCEAMSKLVKSVG